MLVLKAITFFWPFLKEMILGEKTLKESLKTHKGRVLLIGVILFSIALNFFAIPKLVAISREHIELRKKYKEMTEPAPPDAPGPAVVKGPVTPPEPPPSPPRQPEPYRSEPTRTSQNKPVDSQESYRRTKEFFDRIREQEAKQQR